MEKVICSAMKYYCYSQGLYKYGIYAAIAFIFLSPYHLWADDKIFVATYQANYEGLPVKSTRTLTRKQDGSFVLKSQAANFFAELEESSHFTKTDMGLFQPRAYYYKRKIFGSSNKEKIHFDWSKKKAHYSNKKKSNRNRIHSIVEGILDPSLYQIKLQYDMATGHRPLNYTFVKKKRIKNYRFKKVGTSTLTINSKKYQAVKVKRDKEDTETIVWLIPELNYLLGKLTHKEKNGNTYEMMLSSFKKDPELYQEFYSKKKNLWLNIPHKEMV